MKILAGLGLALVVGLLIGVLFQHYLSTELRLYAYLVLAGVMVVLTSALILDLNNRK